MNAPATLRRTLGTVRKELRSLRVVRIAEGPAAGLRIGLRHASADYGRVTNELPVQSAFAEVIQPGQTVYDIGSNVGFFALLAARLVGEKGVVHAFEAAPECSRALERNVRRNGFSNVTVHAMAVSDRSGEVELMQGRHPGGATIAPADRPRDHRRSVVVPCDTIDDLIVGGIAPPDFVKIDVEGAEAAVLGGMATTLARHAPAVLCELDDPTDDGIAAKVQRVRTILDEYGYRIEELDPSYEGSRSRVVHLLGRPVST